MRSSSRFLRRGIAAAGGNQKATRSDRRAVERRDLRGSREGRPELSGRLLAAVAMAKTPSKKEKRHAGYAQVSNEDDDGSTIYGGDDGDGLSGKDGLNRIPPYGALPPAACLLGQELSPVHRVAAAGAAAVRAVRTAVLRRHSQR